MRECSREGTVVGRVNGPDARPVVGGGRTRKDAAADKTRTHAHVRSAENLPENQPRLLSSLWAQICIGRANPLVLPSSTRVPGSEMSTRTHAACIPELRRGRSRYTR
ncbi:hypothetical protein MTO96_003749 [Rhipicephalus appendiculatus]